MGNKTAKDESDSGTKVRRFSVSDKGVVAAKDGKKSKAVSKKATTVVQDKKKKEKGSKNPFGYFKGAWSELRKVQWTNRKQTWQLTLAVILFSGVLTLFIIALDLLFDYLSKEVLL